VKARTFSRRKCIPWIWNNFLVFFFGEQVLLPNVEISPEHRYVQVPVLVVLHTTNQRSFLMDQEAGRDGHWLCTYIPVCRYVGRICRTWFPRRRYTNRIVLASRLASVSISRPSGCKFSQFLGILRVSLNGGSLTGLDRIEG